MFSSGAMGAGACYDLFQHRYRIVLQETDYFCGPAALKSVLESAGIGATQAELAQIARTTQKDGTAPRDMVSTLHFFGFESQMKMFTSYEELLKWVDSGHTVIALVKSDQEAHWVVIESASKDGVTLMDPWFENTGYEFQTPKTFMDRWQATFQNTTFTNLGIVADLESKKSNP